MVRGGGGCASARPAAPPAPSRPPRPVCPAGRHLQATPGAAGGRGAQGAGPAPFESQQGRGSASSRARPPLRPAQVAGVGPPAGVPGPVLLGCAGPRWEGAFPEVSQSALQGRFPERPACWHPATIPGCKPRADSEVHVLFTTVTSSYSKLLFHCRLYSLAVHGFTGFYKTAH